MCSVLNQHVSNSSCVPGINSVPTCLPSDRYRLPLLYCTTQLGKARTRRDIMEGWIIEGNDYQPGLLEMLKAARTPEVGTRLSTLLTLPILPILPNEEEMISIPVWG